MNRPATAISCEPPLHWHALPPVKALSRLDSAHTNLGAAEAARRLCEHGPNRLAPPRRRGPLVRFLKQFHNVLIYVLLAAAAMTAGLGHWVDSGVIVSVVLVNAVIGFLKEGKAEKALDAIRNMLSLYANVRRYGRRCEIAAEYLVPGDVVLLASGDKAPADLRLLEVRNLPVDEAALTGESEPVDKRLDPVAQDAAIGDRYCLAYSGTLVTYGQASRVVVAAGQATELGRIGAMLEQVQEITTPLLRKIAVFARGLSVAILVTAAAIFVLGVTLGGYAWAEIFIAVVALAVAAIPEGLPAILTVTLAMSVQRMARRNAIVRRLPAVETLGSVTVICSDKTGTLTRNEMTVQRVFEVSGTGYAPHGANAIDEREVTLEQAPELHSVRVRASLHGHTALRPCRARVRVSQGRTRAGARDVPHPAHGRRRAPARPRLPARAHRGAGAGRPARAGARLPRHAAGHARAALRRRRGRAHAARAGRDHRPAARGGDRGGARMPLGRHPGQDYHRRPRRDRARQSRVQAAAGAGAAGHW